MNPPDVPRGVTFGRFGVTLKMAAVAVLTLLMLIPLGLIRGVLSERVARRDEALHNITSTWGEPQTVFGPVLMVPYRYPCKQWKEVTTAGKVERVEIVETVTDTAYFLPETLTVTGTLEPSRLHRGIYETVVYRGALSVTGRFARPDFAPMKVAPTNILWDEAEVLLAVTDLRGTTEALVLKSGDRSFPMVPGISVAGYNSGVRAPLKGLDADLASGLPFEITLALNGSQSLRFAPVGVNNDVRLESPWPDPSFQGAFLPAERSVTDKGFTARWKVSFYGRSYAQQWCGQAKPAAPDREAVEGSMFGVDLITVVDAYRYVERSIKYGVLFIVLVFTAFFLFEVLAAVRVHPFQYTLVGVALCLFYLALLSLSELIAFGAAYWAGAVVSTLLIALYSARALRSGARAAGIAVGLLAVYGFLFVILRLQDYSLVLGTAGLFLALAVVMYATRNIDWYARNGQ